MATGGSSKVPLRELANLFSHLGANTKAQISSAFAEAEDMMNFSNNSNVGQQDRRTLSSLVASPVLTATTNNRGFDVSWERLDDRRISSYEVQVSFDNIFSNPTTYNVVDTSLALEGIGTTVYVRARGIRFDGNCGPYSDVVTVNAFATTAGPVVYTRGYDDIPSFYQEFGNTPGPIQHITITPQRQNGGIVVFGSLAAKDNVGGTVTVKINATTLDTLDLTTQQHSTTTASTGFGPAFLTHEGFGFSAADNLNPATATQSGSGIGTHVGWTNLVNATGAMEVVYPADGTDYRQSNMVRGQGLVSKDLKLTNFGATIPSTNTITGFSFTFTGNFTLNCDPTKSFVRIRHMRIIDETGTVLTAFDHTTTQHWPYSTDYSVGAPIPFATFGDPTDLWGQSAGFWTPAKLNDVDFGFDIVAGFVVASGDTSANAEAGTAEFDAILYGATMTVYSINENQEAEVNVFFNGGGVLGCTLNAVEFGSAIS